MWRLRLLGREWWTIAVGAVVVLLVCTLALSGHWRLQPNAGFGPGWHCTYPGKGDPVCVKDPPQQI